MEVNILEILSHAYELCSMPGGVSKTKSKSYSLSYLRKIHRMFELRHDCIPFSARNAISPGALWLPAAERGNKIDADM